MARLDARVRAPAELVSAALVAAATLPLGRLFHSGRAVPTILVTIAAGTGVAWALRRARIFTPLAALIAAAVFFWHAGLLFHRDAMLGPLPTPAMFAEVGRAIAFAIRASTTEVAPVAATPSLLTLIAMVVWAAAWLADDAIHKLRHPLLAIGFVLPVFVFPATLLASPRRWLDAALFIGASLAVMFSDESSRLSRWGRTAGIGTPGWKPGLAARTGGLVTLAAILAAPLVPGYGAEPGFGTGGEEFGRGDRVALNPLVSIQPSLNQTPAVPLFTVKAEEPAYWRITALDQFNGIVWSAPPRRAVPEISGTTIPATVPVPQSRTLKQEITLAKLSGPWLPGAYEAIRVDRRDSVRLEPVTRSLVLSGQMRTGERVDVTSRLISPAPEDLDRITAEDITGDPIGSQFLGLPGNEVPAEIRAAALQITDGETSLFRKAVAIQNHLRQFEYDDQVANGHSYRTMSQFLLEVRRGYCEQFSSTMAVLARVIGIPSRVAIGFAAGDPIGADEYRVTTKHAHAWVELYFPGYGWLPFEPTPRSEITITPTYTTPQALNPTINPEPTTQPTAQPTGSAAPPTSEPRDPDVGGAAGGVAGAPKDRKPLWIALALIAGTLLALPGGAAAKRLLRRRKATNARAATVAHYMDFLDWCAAARVPKRPGETPAEYAGRLAAMAAPAEGPLRDLAAITERTLWAPAATAEAERAAALGKQARHAVAPSLPAASRLMSMAGWGWWKARS